MKSDIRNSYKLLRLGMSPEEIAIKSKEACELFLDSDIYKNSIVIMLYMPKGNEADTNMIAKQAFYDGKIVCYPVTDKNTGNITPFIADKDTQFVTGTFSIYEPVDTIEFDKKGIDVVVAPGIAFDKSGGRVGFGKGCYDRFLNECPAIKVGFCYDNQVCANTFNEKNDVKMNYIVTDKEIIVCK